MKLPLATSSLLQLPIVERCLSAGRRAGVVTYDAKALTERHFVAVGADPGTPTLSLSDTFGNIAAKGTQVRNFQGQLRLSF